MTEYTYEQLKEAPFVIDAIYKGGHYKTARDEVLHILVPKTNVQGGFRYTYVEGNKDEFAFIVIFTSMSELAWPDYYDEETGLFRYYGDNKSSIRSEAGRSFRSTA